MDISVRHLKILFPFYCLYFEEELLDVTMGYGVHSSGTSSVKPMHGSLCLLVKYCKKGLNVTLTD